MKRRIIWLVILPWWSGLYFLLDENNYQGWDALEAADFRMGGTRRQVHDQPGIWRRFFPPMLTFPKGVTSSRIFVEYHRWKYFRFWEFYVYLLMCWQVLIYLRCLLAWNYCCCTSELWIYTTVCWLHYYFISVELILKVANPCIYSGCKFVRLIFLLILFAAVEIVGFILVFKRRTLCSFKVWTVIVIIFIFCPLFHSVLFL